MTTTRSARITDRLEPGPSHIDDLLALKGPALLRLWLVELRKLVDTVVGIVILAVGAVLAGCFGGGAILLNDGTTYGEVARLAGVPGATLVPILAICLVTAERTHRTAVVTYALVPRRSRILLAKALATITLSVIATLLALVAALIITPVGGIVTGKAVAWQLDGRSMIIFAASSVIGALSGFALGLLLRNAPVAIVIVLVWPMVSSLVAGFDATAHLTDWVDPTALSRWEDGVTGVEVGQLITGIATWVMIPGVIGWIRTVRGEVR